MDSENIKAINESYERLYEDWDKAGVMPHNVMGLSLGNLGIGKTVASAAGLVALAGTGLAKATLFAGKHIFMKKGFLKVLKRIGELEAYVMKGQNPQKFRFTATLDGGGTITTARTYDDIKDWMISGIKEEIEQYRQYNEGEHTGTSKKLNRRGMLVSSVGKYNKFFSNINKEFSNVKSNFDDDNIYEKFKNIVNQNLIWSEEYVNLLIKKYEKRFTIGKEDSGYNNKRLALYVSSLKQAWTVVKQEILTKYRQLLMDINRSPEFLELYKIVQRNYKSINNERNTPELTNVLNYVMALAYTNIGKDIKFAVYKENRYLHGTDKPESPCIILEEDMKSSNKSVKDNGDIYKALFQENPSFPRYIDDAANSESLEIKKLIAQKNRVVDGITPGNITVELFVDRNGDKKPTSTSASTSASARRTSVPPVPAVADRVYFKINTIDLGTGDKELIFDNTGDIIKFDSTTRTANIWLKWTCNFSDKNGNRLGIGTIYKQIEIERIK